MLERHERRRSRTVRTAWGAVSLLLGLAAAGCAVHSQAEEAAPSALVASPAPSWQSVRLQPLQDDPSLRPRWRDIADYPYAKTFRSSFRYRSNTVEVRYTIGEGQPQFTIAAPPRALKPNFCYQMKLWGPVVPWPADAQTSNFTNWALGTSGRWSDGLDNLLIRDLGAHVGESMRGYLYFDCFVTAPDGSVTHTGTVNSSFHVTWKTSQRTPNEEDGGVRRIMVRTQADGWAYDRAYPRVVAGLYGEWEPRRPLPGELVLPSGTYSGLEFVLTEESFHSYLTDGGRWRTVLRADVPGFQVP